MPKFNADAEQYPPIELTLGDKTYTATKITGELLTKITEIGKDKSPDALRKQLSVFFSVSEDTFRNIDIRVLAKAVTFVSDELAKQLTPSKPGVA